MSDYTEKEWLAQLKITIKNILINIVDQDDLDYYFDDEAMEIWKRAFTNETYSPSDNNEDLEYLGDIVLKGIFPKYLMKRFPELHNNNYTELNIRYQSKIEQGKLGYKMGFSKVSGEKPHLIRTKGVEIMTINLVADVFEAFFGALDTISNNIVENGGLGYINAWNLISYLYKDVNINNAGSHSKTQVQQIFSRFELPKPLERVDEGKEILIKFTPKTMEYIKQINPKQSTTLVQSNEIKDAYTQTINTIKNLGLIDITEKISKGKTSKNNQTVDIVLTEKHMNFLKGYGIIFKSDIIGHGEAATKAEAEFKAYNDALKTLSSVGITTDWAEKNKLLLDISHKEVEKYIEGVARRLHNENFVRFYFSTPAKTSDKKGAVIQLVGVKPDEKKEVLTFTRVEQEDRKNNNISARALLMKEYATGKK
jgi:dsRNA-specific ribonuclease